MQEMWLLKLWGFVNDGHNKYEYNNLWMQTLAGSPESRGFYLFLNVDRRCWKHDVFLDAMKDLSLLSDCAYPYALQLSRESLHVCSGGGVLADFDKLDDVRVVWVPLRRDKTNKKTLRRWLVSGSKLLRVEDDWLMSGFVLVSHDSLAW